MLYKFQTVHTFPINCGLHFHLYAARLVYNVPQFCESFAVIKPLIVRTNIS